MNDWLCVGLAVGVTPDVLSGVRTSPVLLGLLLMDPSTPADLPMKWTPLELAANSVSSF